MVVGLLEFGRMYDLVCGVRFLWPIMNVCVFCMHLHEREP